MFSYFKSFTPLAKISLTFISSITGISLYRPTLEKISNILYKHNQNYIYKKLPKRIFLVRHGESEGNVYPSLYEKIPDNKLKLTKKGHAQALKAGKELKKMIKNESVKFVVSPYRRTYETYLGIVKSFQSNKKATEIEYKIREQEFGNLNKIDDKIYQDRVFIGRFYYRFLNGENGADCLNRVSNFLESMYLKVQIKNNQFQNYIIVSHGIIMRVFLMKMLDMSIEQYQKIALPDNCKIWILEKGENGKYKLISKIKYMH